MWRPNARARDGGALSDIQSLVAAVGVRGHSEASLLTDSYAAIRRLAQIVCRVVKLPPLWETSP